MSKLSRLILAGITILIVIGVAVGAIFLIYPTLYQGRIYPGVSIGSLDVGGLTVEEAQARLAEHLPDPESQTLIMRTEKQNWRLTWADVGRGYDCASMAQAAYQLGREGSLPKQALSAWRIRLRGRSAKSSSRELSAIEPRIVEADPVRVRALLEEIAPHIYSPPVDAQLRIESGEITSREGEMGHTLDLEASATRVLRALDEGATQVDLAIKDIPPRIPSPEPARTQAQSLLAQPFALVADDPLTDYYEEFTAAPERVAMWLRVVPGDGQILLEIDELAVHTWLLEVEPRIGEDRILKINQALTHTLAALETGKHQARPSIHHPEGVYVVQPGDTFFDISYSHGFPQWRLEEANPDIDTGALVIGMELTIPSIDVLFPEPLVPDKRIEISLPEQKLRAYENDELLYEFTCSSGMTSTPTIAGQFQVLFKEPDAYASRWSLEMPYFMAVYQEGPDFFNGIHELPIRADGGRLWASVLGWPASYGCIILDVGDAELLYDWAPVGTLVRITGVAPGTPTYQERVEQQGE
jgi:hypothetical protein